MTPDRVDRVNRFSALSQLLTFDLLFHKLKKTNVNRTSPLLALRVAIDTFGCIVALVVFQDFSSQIMTKHRLKTQLENADQIKSVLREAKISFKLADGRKVTTLLVYLPLCEAGYDLGSFFSAVKEGLLTNFVFSCSEIEKKLGLGNEEIRQKIFDKALRKLSQHTAQGELGELILFTLLDVYFEAPKILSKVSMKTSPRMPVFGADAVHGQIIDGDLKLLLGESKLHENFKTAATMAAKSIAKALREYPKEFDLLDSYIDCRDMDDDLRDMLLRRLDPFENDDLEGAIISPCFVGFAQPEIISSAKSETDFLEKYESIASSYVKNYFQKVEKFGMSIEDTALLLLPFASIEDLVREFIASTGIEQ